MDDRLSILADKAKALPKSPGVYLMKDDKGRVIYIGKSASLRDRDGSTLFAASSGNPSKLGAKVTAPDASGRPGYLQQNTT